jgi:dienelactone hydrolase
MSSESGGGIVILGVICAGALATWMMATPGRARGAIKTQTITYKDGDTVCKGFLAYDDANIQPRPGVLVVPEWWGLTDFARHRAEMLAGLGYTAFAADMYGDGKNTDDPKQAGAWAAIAKDKPALRKRAKAALAVLAAQPTVDKQRLAAIGYCFGGTTVLELACDGGDVGVGSRLLGVASFHGGLAQIKAEDCANIKAKVLIATGADDAFVPMESVLAFGDALKKAGVDYQLLIYGHAVHAFTNPDADSHHMPNIAYNAEADHRSWEAMKDFFAEIFAAHK